MFRERRHWLLIAACAALVLAPVVAVADDDDDETEGKLDLAGTWVRVTYKGEASSSPVNAMISRLSSKRYAFMGNSWLDNPPEPSAGNFFVNQRTIAHGEIVRTGLNEYAFTTIWYNGQTDDPDRPRTTVAVVCNAPLIQTGPDRWQADFRCFGSCNPCDPFCWSYGLAECSDLELWDPFDDPYAFCSGGGLVEYRRVPLDEKCLEE